MCVHVCARARVSIKENRLRKHRTETTGKQDKPAGFHMWVKKNKMWKWTRASTKTGLQLCLKINLAAVLQLVGPLRNFYYGCQRTPRAAFKRCRGNCARPLLTEASPPCQRDQILCEMWEWEKHQNPKSTQTEPDEGREWNHGFIDARGAGDI